MTEASISQSIEFVVPARGSDIEPTMTGEEVRALQERLQDEQFRHELAAFTALEANRDQFGDRDDDFVRLSSAWVGISNYRFITIAAESETWPEDISPPEFYDQAIRRMEERGAVNG